MKIKSIKPKEIADSRGNPTVEVEIETNKGKFFGACPSGASKGINEALELRDEDGRGVKKAISNINKIIAPALKGKDFKSQQEIDELMIKLDATENKSHLGVNAILPVSIACCRALALENKVPLYKYIRQVFSAKGGSALGGNPQLSTFELPKPCFNIIEGGAHAKNSLNIQEFMVIPQKTSFRENFVAASQIYQSLKEILEKNFGNPGEGDEGGFAPQISKTEQALFSLKSSFEKFPESKIGLDAAASQFYKEGKYQMDGQELSRTGLLDFYKELVAEFPIAFIEDPFGEEDWAGFQEITKELQGKAAIIGDDLLTTNMKRIKEAQNKKACNGVIIKLNQIGTVTETLGAVKMAKEQGWKVIVSHRSGETHDDFIADLAAGAGADYIKSGAPTRPERMVKYNRLMEIEAEIHAKK